MAKIVDVLEDWCLQDFEEKSVKNGHKRLFLFEVGNNIVQPHSSVLHINGMAIPILDYKISKLSKLTDKELEFFGIRNSIIPASCEHPPFYTYTYDGYMCSSYRGRRDCLKDYIERNPGILELKKEYVVVTTWNYAYINIRDEKELTKKMTETYCSYVNMYDPYNYMYRSYM